VLDTGASTCLIDESLAQELKLQSRSKTRMMTAAGISQVPVYQISNLVKIREPRAIMRLSAYFSPLPLMLTQRFHGIIIDAQAAHCWVDASRSDTRCGTRWATAVGGPIGRGASPDRREAAWIKERDSQHLFCSKDSTASACFSCSK
jgi:hypothetical protein